MRLSISMRRPMRCLIGAALLACAPLCLAYEESEPWQEARFELPAAPATANLIEFNVGPSNPNRFYVDGESIQLGADGVVRYTQVVVSPSGVRNTSFEGIRCKTYERRLYAVGRPDGSWRDTPDSRWERIAANQYNRHTAVLARQYFCDLVMPVRDARTARANLRAGASTF